MLYCAIAAFIVMAGCYLGYEKLKTIPRLSRMPGLLVKCAATAMAVLVCLLGALKGGSAADWVIFAGLVACMIADGALGVHFMLGTAIFGLGHVLYMVAFCMTKAPTWGSLAVFVVFMVILTWLFTRWKAGIGRRFPAFYAYGTLLCAMTALAFPQSPLLFIGAVLFAFSDATLAYGLFIKRNVKLGHVSLAAYYVGQFLIGFSVFLARRL